MTICNAEEQSTYSNAHSQMLLIVSFKECEHYPKEKGVNVVGSHDLPFCTTQLAAFILLSFHF